MSAKMQSQMQQRHTHTQLQTHASAQTSQNDLEGNAGLKYLRRRQKGPCFVCLGHRAATTCAALRRPPVPPVVYPSISGDMHSAAAQSFNLTLQAILDGHKGFGDDSKLNSLALVDLIFSASDHSGPVLINLDSCAGN